MTKILFGMLLASIIGLAAVAGAGCSHVQNVAQDCISSVTPALVDEVVTDLAGSDYEAALTKLGATVAPCTLVDAVKEVVDVATSAKTQVSPVTIAVTVNGRSWLSRHAK